MKHLIYFACKISNFLTEAVNLCSEAILLAIRLYLFKIFFWAGMLKLTSWSSTLAIFQNVYQIAGVTPYMAAVLATNAEIFLPLFMVLGIGARLPALGLLVFNIFNVIFNPALLKAGYSCALKDHVIWGLLIGIVLIKGHGKLSLDYWLQNKVCKDYKC